MKARRTITEADLWRVFWGGVARGVQGDPEFEEAIAPLVERIQTLLGPRWRGKALAEKQVAARLASAPWRGAIEVLTNRELGQAIGLTWRAHEDLREGGQRLLAQLAEEVEYSLRNEADRRGT